MKYFDVVANRLCICVCVYTVPFVHGEFNGKAVN